MVEFVMALILLFGGVLAFLLITGGFILKQMLKEMEKDD